MKKVLFLTALIAATLPVDAQQLKYTVNGVCDNNGGTIILVNRLTREQIGTTVVADGKFSLSGTAEKDALMAIGDQSSDWATLFFNDGTPVSVNLNDSTLKGSPLNERLVAYDIAANAPIGSVQKQMSMMTEEEQERRKNELAAGLMIAMMKMGVQIEKIFKEENETLIPVAFIDEYEQFYGEEKLDSLVKTKPVWASHPIVQEKLKDMAQQREQEEKKNVFIGQQFTDLEEADVDGKNHNYAVLALN